MRRYLKMFLKLNCQIKNTITFARNLVKEKKYCWYTGKPQCFRCKKFSHIKKNCMHNIEHVNLAKEEKLDKGEKYLLLTHFLINNFDVLSRRS